MNIVSLIGRLTADPEIRYTSDNMPVARYRLAVDRPRANADGQREADFISCVAFGKSADFARNYLRKGLKIGVVGSIRTGSYTKQDGTKAYTTDVIVNGHTFCEARKDAGPGYRPDQGYQGAQDIGDGFMTIPSSADDEGLPWN